MLELEITPACTRELPETRVPVPYPAPSPDRNPMAEFYLSGLSDKDKPWDYHRGLADQVRDLYRGSEFDHYVDRIAICAKLLEFALSSDDSGEMRFRLQAARFCRVPRCPVCQWRRSLMWKARFFKALPKISADYPTARWIFLTLTIRNCEISDLRDTLTLMNKAWKRLSVRKIFPALGWVKSFEVTRNKETGMAHPHFHVLMMVPAGYFARGYINQQEWTQLWRDCLRADYDPVVDVRAVKAKSAKAGQADPGVGLTVAIKETLKYTVKGEELIADASWLIELTHQLYKTKAIALGGVLKNYLSEAEPDNEDLIHADQQDNGEVAPDDPRWWFSWREMVGRYMGNPKEDS